MEVREKRRKNAKGKTVVSYFMDYIDPETGERMRPTLPGITNRKDADKVAEKRWAEINLAHELGEDADPTEGEKNITLAQLLALDLARPGIAQSTRSMETYRHETLKRILGSNTRVLSLRTKSLVRFQTVRSAEAAHSTVNDELAILHSALARAKKHGILTRFACEFPDRLPETEPRRRFLQPEQVEALLQHLTDPRHRAVAEFMYRMGGMRPGEIWRLTWADVDLSQRTITIKGTKRGRSTRVRSRTLPLGHGPLSTLQAMLKAGKVKSTDLVFGVAPEARKHNARRTGKPGMHAGVQMNNRWGFNGKLKEAAEAAGIPHPETISAYTLRHSAATNATGADITDVAYMLGHSDPRMTMQVYRHARMDRVHAGLDSLQGHPKGTTAARKKRAA